MVRTHRRAEESENHDRWLISYADFLTLLFAFFVLMYASSQGDKGKAKQVADAVTRALETQGLSPAALSVLGGASVPNKESTGGKSPKAGTGPSVIELLPSLNLLTQALHDEIAAGSVKISMQERGLTISFAQAALFPSGTDEISPDFYGSIEKVAKAMQQIPNPVRLEGHTDAVPIHTARFRSNWELSAARSTALLTLLTDHFGVQLQRISIAGYADTAPVDTNESEQGRARNRRVDIVILNETGLKGEPVRYHP